jgi:hypothetical protein
MITLRYTFDGEDFDYDVSRFDIEQRLYDYLREEWTQEQLVEYIIDNDGAQFDYVVDFLGEIHDLFESDAEEFYYECKDSDNGVDQGDFV